MHPATACYLPSVHLQHNMHPRILIYHNNIFFHREQVSYDQTLLLSGFVRDTTFHLCRKHRLMYDSKTDISHWDTSAFFLQAWLHWHHFQNTPAFPQPALKSGDYSSLSLTRGILKQSVLSDR